MKPGTIIKCVKPFRVFGLQDYYEFCRIGELFMVGSYQVNGKFDLLSVSEMIAYRRSETTRVDVNELIPEYAVVVYEVEE